MQSTLLKRVKVILFINSCYMCKRFSIIISLFCALTFSGVKAQSVAPSFANDSLQHVKTTLTEWGIGRANLLDTYLSPLTYKGTDVAVAHHTERLAHWGKKKVTVSALYAGHYAYAQSPTDDGKYMDAEFTFAGGWHYNWRPSAHWRLAMGGLMELSGGFTYNTRNSNNPAQGRLGTSLMASGLTEYYFLFFKQKATVRLQLDGQLMGVQFSPEYGQSYYEIFSLGHTSGIVHFTHPGNCPSARAQLHVVLPIKRSRISVGYQADVRQSLLGGLKRHAWRNVFMIGFARNLKRL